MLQQKLESLGLPVHLLMIIERQGLKVVVAVAAVKGVKIGWAQYGARKD